MLYNTNLTTLLILLWSDETSFRLFFFLFFLVSLQLFLKYFTPSSSVSIVNLEQAGILLLNARWDFVSEVYLQYIIATFFKNFL